MHITKFQRLTAIPLLAAGSVVAAGVAATASEDGPDVNASIVWVDVEFPASVEVPWEDGATTVYDTTVVTFCTGFFVSGRAEIATAGHCVEADAATETTARHQVVGDLEYEGYDVSGLDLPTLAWPVEIGDPTAYVGQPSGIQDGLLSSVTRGHG